MPASSKARNPRNIEITFFEDTHKYVSIIDGKEINYISGTTFISKFFPPFDPTGRITKACARKRGMTVESLKEEWRINAKNACDYGTRVHETVEDTLLGRELRNKPNNTKEEYAFRNARIMAEKLLTKMDIVAVEKILFDERLQIAGTADIIARSKKDGRLWILDNKTNKCIEVENKYNNFGLEMLSNVPATNYYEYTYQLNLYEYLLKHSEYIDKNESVGKALLHITENGVKTYNLEDKQKDMEKMMVYYEKNKDRFLNASKI